jgi:hypothetical protein
VVITLVVVCGWAFNAVLKIVLYSMGVDSFGQFMTITFGNYLIVAASSINAPVLFAFRYF